jgi:hypothetical protein
MPHTPCGVFWSNIVDTSNIIEVAHAASALAPPNPVVFKTPQRRLGADMASVRTAKLERLKKWKPSVSHPCLHRDVKLFSVFAQRLFSMTFFRAQVAVYSVSVMLPIICTQQQCEQFDKDLHKLLKDTQAKLTDEIARVRKVKEDNGVKGAITYTDPLAAEVGLYTPEAGMFLGILQSFDVLATIVDELWMTTMWEKSQRNASIFMWRNVLLRLASEMNKLQIRARSAVSRQQALVANKEMKRTASLSDPSVMGAKDFEEDAVSHVGEGDSVATELGLDMSAAALAAAADRTHNGGPDSADSAIIGDFHASVRGALPKSARRSKLPAAGTESLMSASG